MIKGELTGLLRELRPEKKWPKPIRLADLIDFAVQDLPDDDNDPRVMRARELAEVIYRSERR